MQKVLIQAYGIEPTQLAPSQLASVIEVAQALEKDPRVRFMYGTVGHSAGITAVCEINTLKEAEQIAGRLQISGFPSVEVTPLVNAERFQAGLQEVSRWSVRTEDLGKAASLRESVA